MKNLKFCIQIVLVFAAGILFSKPCSACTGITLTARDGSRIIARTMEWGGSNMPSKLVLVPRGYTQRAILPSGRDGLLYTAKYGYAGIGVLEHNFIAEAVNEKGLAAELFYFPNYGESEKYDSSKKDISITDAEFLAWVLGNFANVKDMVKELDNIRLVGYGQGFSSPHYNVMDKEGNHVVLEYYGGKFHVVKNTVGVITNSPYFEWHLLNLNNYINIFASTDKPRKINSDLTLESFGVGSASYGLPGDLTPPSRFVRAAFYVHTASPTTKGKDAVLQSFQILNNFDIPIGTEYDKDERNKIPDMLSATQWTTSIDTKALKLYYRTEWNYSIRCIDLQDINFAKAKYQVMEMDRYKEHPIEKVNFKS